MKHDQLAKDHLLDQALAEIGGSATPPDLVATVARRLQTGAGLRLVAELDASPPGSSVYRRLTAAIVLFALAIVTTIALMVGQPDTVVPLQDPTLPAITAPAVVVTSSAEIDALAAEVRSVQAHGITDDDLRALLRLRDLEELDIRRPTITVLEHGKSPDPRQLASVTNECFAIVAQFSKLRRLRLTGQHGVGYPLPGRATISAEFVAATFGQLERLPVLEELGMPSVGLPFYIQELLPRLRSLRRLDLSNNPMGIQVDAIVRCQGLRSLSLRGCSGMDEAGLATLARLPFLEELDLGDVDCRGPQISVDRITPGLGVTDEALRGIAKAPRLRQLLIQSGPWTNDGVLALGSCRTLRELDLRSGLGGPIAAGSIPASLESLIISGSYGNEFCRELAARLSAARRLDLSDCTQITDAGIAALLGMRSLQHLYLRNLRDVTPAGIRHLQTMTWLRQLDIRQWPGVAVDDAVALREAQPDLEVLATDFTREQIEAAGMSRRDNFHEVRTGEAAAVPPTAERIIGRALTHDDLTRLARLPRLRDLELPTVDDPASVTDDDLAALAAAPSLQKLRLPGNEAITAVGIKHLRRLPALRHLDLGLRPIDAELLAAIAELPGLTSLDLTTTTGWTEEGLQRLFAMQQLTGLAISGIQGVASGELAGLRRLTHLRSLQLRGHFPAAVFAAITTLRELEDLDLCDGPLDDAALRTLLELPNLQTLGIGNTAITPASIDLLTSATRQLRQLDLRGTAWLLEEHLARLRTIGIETTHR